MRPRRVVLVLLALLVLLLVLGEVGARIGNSLAGKGGAKQSESASPTLYAPHPFIGYVLQPGAVSDPKRKRSYRVNSLGFRGEEISRAKPEGTYRIVCVGGSTTWGWDSYSDDKTWPAILQRTLEASGKLPGDAQRVEVINAGVPGYTLMESFVNLKMRVLPLEPDLVIVYHAANDARVIARGDVLPDYTHMRRVWSEPAPPSFWATLSNQSQLLGLILGTESEQRDLEHILHVPGFENLPIREAAEVDEGLAIIETTLREMNALARANGTELALCTFAWSLGPHPKPNMQDWMDHQVALMERVNEVIRAVARSEDAFLIDVNAKGPKTREEFTDIIHLTDAGRRKVAKTIAAALQWRYGTRFPSAR